MDIQIARPGIDWPAWVQAVGSVLAILTSAFFAIWVPLYIRELERRDVARRARSDALTVANFVLSQVMTLEQKGPEASGELLSSLMRAQGQSNLAITATIPLDNLGPEATGALTTVASFAHFLPDAVTRAGEIHEPVPPEYLGQMRRQLEEAIATLRGLVLHRHEGVWRWISPELSEWLRKGNKVS